MNGDLGARPALGAIFSNFRSWDFYDVAGVGGGPPDRKVDFSDTLLILTHFGHPPDNDIDDYRLDRYIPDSSQLWRTAPSLLADGIDFTDAFASLESFGHLCSGGT